ncbi:MAG TPA: hypothetical protein VFO34_01580 [Candidatus Acidoferrales bacterium]|nr:hypothetical protein [Candidatus Acidoferrales bacterium]
MRPITFASTDPKSLVPAIRCKLHEPADMNTSEKQQFLASQPRPRTVRLSRRGKSWVLLLSSILAAVETSLVTFLLTRWLRESSVAAVAGRHGIALYSALLLPFLPVMFRRGLAKEKELIANGEVAVATVISTSNSSSQVNRNDHVRTVRYTFLDKSGAIVEGSSVDSTLMLRDYSSMLVFYDSDDPTKHVAQCAAYYHVVVPGLDADNLEDAG